VSASNRTEESASAPGDLLRQILDNQSQAFAAERLQSALYRIADTTSTVTDMGAFYAAMHRIVGELMDARNFYIAILDEATSLIAFPYFVDEAEPRPEPRAPGRGLTEYVLRTGAPLLADPEVMDRLLREGATELVGAPSLDWLGVPLKRGEETFGVLAVQTYDESVRFTDHDREVLTFVSQHVATAIDRWRAADALRKSEELFRTLAETAPCAIFIYRGSRVRYANPATTAITGYGREDAAGLNLWDVVHPDDRERAQERALARQRGEDVPSHLELRIIDKKGKVRWLDYSAAVVEYEGRPAVLGVAFDVSERKRDDDRIKSLAYHDTLTCPSTRSRSTAPSCATSSAIRTTPRWPAR
jgi:PAS domain S-box-containing protein